jgi:hypothetical protein
MDDSYDTDILAWSERQAGVIRSLRARRDLPNELDLEHVAEEIEDVGRSELNAAQSFIRQIFIHIIKAASAPDSDSTAHWQSETLAFHHDLLDRISPSMITRIDADKLWQRAIKEADAAMRYHHRALARNLPSACPFEINEIVSAEFEFGEAVARLTALIGGATNSQS